MMKLVLTEITRRASRRTNVIYYKRTGNNFRKDLTLELRLSNNYASCIIEILYARESWQYREILL